MIWESLLRMIEAPDVSAQLRQMMGTPRFKELLNLAISEKWTTDQKRAALAALSAMIVHDDPKSQARYAKAYLADDHEPPADDDPW